MANTSCFVSAFQSMCAENEQLNFTAKDLILNMVIPTSIAGEMHENAMKNYHEEKSVYHLCHKHLASLEISAGSSSDGLSLPEVSIQKGDIQVTEGADEDIMFLFTALVVDSGNRRSFCSTDSTKSSPGYTRLVFNTDWLKKRPSKNHREMSEEQMMNRAFPHFLESEQSMYIDRNKLILVLRSSLHGDLRSTEKERRFVYYNVNDIKELPEVSYSHHGPAITVDRVAFEGTHSKVFKSKDYVVALPCPRWPSEASEWITRSRLWPPKSLVRRIVKNGCHIVAKQDKEVKDVRDFLFSFSQCEKVLALNLTVVQKRCYMLFKYLFKYSINKTKRGLSTYHCKTVFFRRCETTSPERWTCCSVFECLSWLLSDMERYLKNGYLPQYFISDMNMISGISQKAVKSILCDIAKIISSPVHTILDLVNTKTFCWLSIDISVKKIVFPLLESKILTKQTAQQTIADFVSVLLDKGEVAIAVSILCDTQNAQVMPPTNAIIKYVECALETKPGRGSIALKGLLATLLHERALECSEANDDCGNEDNLMQKSIVLFEEIINHVGSHIWVVAEYFNFLFNSEQYGKIVQHFLAMLRENILFTGGIYTNIFSHNILTVDPEMREAAEITIPSLVYITYKAVIACAKIASNAVESFTKTKIIQLAQKILQNLSSWFRNKLNMYPETVDENIHVLLGLGYRAIGDDKNFQQHFNTAESHNHTYGDKSDDIFVEPRLTDNIKNAHKKHKPKRFHPYELIGKREKPLRMRGKSLQIRRFILNSFTHW